MELVNDCWNSLSGPVCVPRSSATDSEVDWDSWWPLLSRRRIRYLQRQSKQTKRAHPKSTLLDDLISLGTLVGISGEDDVLREEVLLRPARSVKIDKDAKTLWCGLDQQEMTPDHPTSSTLAGQEQEKKCKKRSCAGVV